MDSDSWESSRRPAFFILDYENVKYDFRLWMQSSLGVEDLSKLHACSPYAPLTPDDRSMRAKWSSLCQRKLSGLLPILYSFIQAELSPHFLATPTVRHPPMFRIHPPGWESISPYHKDSEYGLSPGAINVWIPLTDVWDSNALWIESAEDRHDFRPVCLHYGQSLVFDAVHLTHGSRKNTTSSTRASLDFRCHGSLRGRS